MVKKTKFDHHPVMVTKGFMLGDEEYYGGIVGLETEKTLVALTASIGTTTWSLLSLAALANKPKHAIAAILNVEVNDDGSAAAARYMQIAKPGVILAAKTGMCHCPHLNDMVAGHLVIVELSEDWQFAYAATASGAGQLDYNIKLLGWIIDPSKTRPAFPGEDLKAIFVVNQ